LAHSRDVYMAGITERIFSAWLGQLSPTEIRCKGSKHKSAENRCSLGNEGSVFSASTRGGLAEAGGGRMTPYFASPIFLGHPSSIASLASGLIGQGCPLMFTRASASKPPGLSSTSRTTPAHPSPNLLFRTPSPTLAASSSSSRRLDPLALRPHSCHRAALGLGGLEVAPPSGHTALHSLCRGFPGTADGTQMITDRLMATRRPAPDPTRWRRFCTTIFAARQGARPGSW